MKYFLTLIILLFPSYLHSEQPRFQKKLLPMFCMPIEAFEEGQKKVGEEQYVFGVVKIVFQDQQKNHYIMMFLYQLI